MDTISFPAIVRTLAAALFLAAFATGAHAARRPPPVINLPPPPPPPAPARSGNHGPFLPDASGAPRASDACAGGLILETPSPFGDAADVVQALSRDTEKYIKECRCVSQQCVADALDRYAEALAAVVPRLPPQLQDMPNVVAQAARRVRAARTKAQAVKALHEAIAIIHKDISLVRAEDPATQQRETRSGAFVADTLNVASLSLEKAGGL